MESATAAPPGAEEAMPDEDVPGGVEPQDEDLTQPDESTPDPDGAPDAPPEDVPPVEEPGEGNDDEAGEPEAETSDELTLFVSDGKLTATIGGKKPTSSSIAIVGGKVGLEGQFEKGEIVPLRIDVLVNDVGLKDSEDPKTGQIVATERRHKARIVAIERYDGDYIGG